ncbi:multidrug effflux MFS transporter [Mesorhizobium sp. YIM 152430]|uniref:multidrug effflux MFS transporter n=1 Tax=Mesorhizobium sp. YIM 152430 TaxID=3031761 RepID=UPI0023DC1981|nr:multidrug effflux MFS transporter [Mesorhizobium sp. YIM 152430]MDF1599911.1 multidrug effflux MFS transporter [Mesorhizobium sp. YIM 152430]
MTMPLAHRAATPPHIFTLVMATASSALAMNVFLPSLPAMARHFDADYSVVQLAVALYLVATAVLQLLIGPASDRFGRRPVLLICFAVFLVGTLAAIFAPTIEILLFCRILQAFSAAGMVLSRAIIRDTVGPDQAASKIGYVTMGMTLVPMIGPVIGGFLDELYGWQSTFLLTLAFGVTAFAIIWIDLGETNLRPSSSLFAQVRSYPELIKSERFWGYTLTAAFTSGTFFAFLGGGPYVASEIFGLSPSQYGFYFGFVSVGYMVGNFLSGRLSSRLGINTMLLTGNIVAATGMSVPLILYFAGYVSPASLFVPVMFVGLGNGMTLPNAMAGIVSVRPHIAGSASGLGGALQIGGGAGLSMLAGALLGPETGPAPLLWIMLASSCLGIVASLYVLNVAARKGELAR